MDFDALMRRLSSAVETEKTTRQAGSWRDAMAMVASEARNVVLAWETGERERHRRIQRVVDPAGRPLQVTCVVRFYWQEQTWIKRIDHVVAPKEGDRLSFDGSGTQAFKVEHVTHHLGNSSVLLDCTVERLTVDLKGHGYEVEPALT